jgi:HAD superfamily hydrolase (TIGR01490 family)
MSRMTHFWDMDHTIINNDCDVSWKEFMLSRNLADKTARTTANFFYEQYKNESLDINDFLRFQLAEFKGHTAEHMRRLCKEHFEEVVEATIYDQARKMILEQQESGDLVCLITATNRYIAEPLAKALKIDHLLATELEIKDELFTGSHSGTYCCGRGKIEYMEKFLTEHGGNFEDCSYFGDSSNDIVVLEKVGEPIAVNPSEKLQEKAMNNNWVIFDFGFSYDD